MRADRHEMPKGPDRLGRMSIVLFALGVMAIAGLIAIWRVRQDRAVTLTAARQELATFAQALGMQIEAMVGDGVGAAVAGTGAIRLADADAGQMLSQMLTGGTYVRALFVMHGEQLTFATRGPDIAAATLPLPAELAQSAQPVWFGAIREDDAGGVILPVARRTSTGTPASWAGALIRISDLDAVYSQLQWLDTSVALVTLDGLALVQLPLTADAARNEDLSDTPIYRQFLQQPVQPITLLDGPHFRTGTPRLHAIYRMQGLPAVTTAGRSLDDALEGWRRRSTLLAGFFALWAGAVFVLAGSLQALYNRRWLHLRTLAAAQQEVAEARRAELDARQSLTRELLIAQERGRQRLARELHDGVGQALSVLRNRASLLKRTALPDTARTHVDAVLDLAGEIIEDLRGVAHNLTPLHLEELGLTRALQALVERVDQSSELAVHARIENVDDVLHGESAVHVYRIVQEALSNVLKHSGADNAWVEMVRDIGHVELQVRDDGRGMPAGNTRRGLGLSSIAERSGIIGATFVVEANGARGTRLIVRLPLQVGKEGDILAASGGTHG